MLFILLMVPSTGPDFLYAKSSEQQKKKKRKKKKASTQKESSGILNISSSSAEFKFDNEIITTSPGQACVFYLKDQVLGGGWITKTTN